MIGTPNYPLLMASGIAVMVAGLIGTAAMTGALPALAAKQRAAAVKVCANCGVVTAIRKHGQYDVTVEMDDGRSITISQHDAPKIELGDRVRLNGDFLVPG